MDKFGSVENIKRASEEELSEVAGIGPTLARTIKEQMNKDEE